MFLSHLLFLSSLWALSASCPSTCDCEVDSKGRQVVSCMEGGIIGPVDFFNMSTDTQVLKISAPESNLNELTMSPVIKNYKKLEEIRITRSNIPQLGTHFFYGLQKLDVLDLSQNNITQPLDSNFRGLTKLKELYLDDNRIYSLPSGTFRYLQELKVLSIQRNRITELMPRIFIEIGKLKVLKLSGNNLKELNPVVFEDVKELRSLECRSCGLTKIDKQVYVFLQFLTQLDLGDNELTSITSDEFSPLTNLRVLKLDGNRITAIKGSVFLHQRELKRLNLARNGLTKVSRQALANLHNLTELDLSRNKLENPEDGLFEPVASTLEVLVLNGNHLSVHTLQSLLDGVEVRELRLSGCGLSAVPAVPQTVRVLDLSGNHLSAVPADAIPEELKELDISGNKLRGLDQDVMAKLDRLRSLKLDRNPWSCDLCNIVPLLERANRSVAVGNVECAEPYAAKGRKLGVVKREELTWCTLPDYSSGDANFFLLGDDGRIGLIAAGSSVCLLFLAVAVVLGALCYSRRHAAKYYTHEDKLAMEGDSIFDNHSPLFCDDRELSFKFPLEKKLSVSTIDEIKKEHAITNGT